MTDSDAIDSALSAVAPASHEHVLLRRNGRPFMALPADRLAAIRTLGLYQPQKRKAVLAMCGIRLLAIWGLHRIFLPRQRGAVEKVTLDPDFAGCAPGTAGVMLGSPEHRVRRAILSYRSASGWEVAKLAFGNEGQSVIEGEFSALRSMPHGMPGIPHALGVHHGDGLSILRLPYFHGRPLASSEAVRAIELLESWIRTLPVRPTSDFPEWPAIRMALETTEAGRAAIARLAKLRLRPVIRHGDFARWNLLEMRDGSIMAIDWEWGHPEGMPGIDLVHLFSQDARLVHQLSPEEVVRVVERSLSSVRCHKYLETTGWGENVRDMILASIAFTVGTGQQANEQILEAALASCDR